MEGMAGTIRPIDPPRFLCRAEWRCQECDTHWTAMRTFAKAFRAAMEHAVEHRGRNGR